MVQFWSEAYRGGCDPHRSGWLVVQGLGRRRVSRVEAQGLHEATTPCAVLRYHRDQLHVLLPAKAWIANNWARRVGANPRFRFTAKLFRGFTHERNVTVDDERQFKEGITPLPEAGRLGALLLQFPWSCRNDEGNRAYLFDLFRRFRDFPLVLEVRHASWNQQAILDMLAELGSGSVTSI